jgi:uncharacterized protein
MTADPITIPSGDVALEGVLALPESSEASALLVVCHPHPLQGGSMDNNVVLALCDAALQEGLAALRFNFRGVGRSGGTYAGGAPETADVLAVLEAARRLQPERGVSLAGYSFGAARASEACLQISTPPRCLVLVSPPLASAANLQLPAGGLPTLLISGDADRVCPVEALSALAHDFTLMPDCIAISGADHSWWGYEDELRDTVAGFLRWHASGGPVP